MDSGQFNCQLSTINCQLTKVGKAPDPEVSQKTCKAYYFDGFEERPDEKNKTSDVFLFLFHSQFAVLLGSVFNYFAIIIRKRSMVRLTG